MTHSRAASVKVVELPGLPDHGDVSDWIDTGGTRKGGLGASGYGGETVGASQT